MVVYSSLVVGSLLALGQLQVLDPNLPAEVRGKVGEFIVVRAQTSGQTVRWLLLDEGPAFLPTELLKDSRTSVVFSLKPGKFRVLAYTAVNGEPTLPAICFVVVGDPPKPAPPPVPPPPVPSDPLVAKFQAAYNSSPDPPATKAKQRDSLIGLYSAMVEYSKDTSILTTTDLLSDLKKTAEKLLNPSALVELRKVIAAELSFVLGESAGLVLDDAKRKKAVEVFSRISKALEALK